MLPLGVVRQMQSKKAKDGLKSFHSTDLRNLHTIGAGAKGLGSARLKEGTCIKTSGCLPWLQEVCLRLHSCTLSGFLQACVAGFHVHCQVMSHR